VTSGILLKQLKNKRSIGKIKHRLPKETELGINHSSDIKTLYKVKIVQCFFIFFEDYMQVARKRQQCLALANFGQ